MSKRSVQEMAERMARENGLINLSRRELCERIGIPDGSFPYVAGCSFTELVEDLRQRGVDAPHYVVSKRRASATLRKKHLLRIAVELAEEVGYLNLTRALIAERAGVSAGLVTKYFRTMHALRRDVMRHAVKHGVLEVVAQGLAYNDEQAKKADRTLKARAAALLTEG